ncbi:hypothetical protein UPYG_G00090420 [Umbra pygmaea]|uniref:THAP domain-containing protein 1 n=1 Tax=Umbra pygmaea TaxID=75934 RepID=A0ABD0XIK0_UMBPY
MAETKSRCHCSVPLCKSNKQRQPYLSFHGFPTELTQRKKWIKAVRRDEGPNFNIKQGSTFVCSRHFNESDYVTGIVSSLASPSDDVANFTNRGRNNRLKIGSVPSRFQWNNWGLPRRESAYKRASTRLGHEVYPALSLEQPLLCKEEAMEEVAVSVVMTEHDYGFAPKPGQPAYEMMETDPDWAPSLHLGHTEITRTNTALSARRRKREKRKNTLQPAEEGEQQIEEETCEAEDGQGGTHFL